MAIRVQVVATYGAEESQFAAGIKELTGHDKCSGMLHHGSCDDWQWARASVWTIDGGSLQNAAKVAGCPTMRVCTSDGIVWSLTLSKDGLEDFIGVHYFTMVGADAEEIENIDDEYDDEDFPEGEFGEVAGIDKFDPKLQFLWDEAEATRLEKEYADKCEREIPGLDNYFDYGVILPTDVVQSMKTNPQQADNLAFIGHSKQMVDELERFGFPVEREEMLRLLTEGPLNDFESDSDLGNLPRFLEQLGIQGVFADYAQTEDGELLDDTDDADPDHEIEKTPPPRQIFQTVDMLRTQSDLTSLVGGPFSMDHPVLLHLFAHLLQDDPDTFVQLEFPDSKMQPDPLWQKIADVEIRQVRQDGRNVWQLCFQTKHWWCSILGIDDLHDNKLSTALKTCPDKTNVEFTFVLDKLAEKCHRYSGSLRNGQFELEQIYPDITLEILSATIVLVEQTFSKTAIEILPKEEEVAKANHKRSLDELPKIRDGKIMPEVGGRAVVVQTLLFERLEDSCPWDVETARQLVEDDWQEFRQFLEQAERDLRTDINEGDEDSDPKKVQTTKNWTERMAEIFNATQVPHSGVVAYRGKTGKYMRASMTSLKHITKAMVKLYDEEMAALGFTAIGDFVGEVSNCQEVVRTYGAHPFAMSLCGRRNQNNQIGWAQVAGGMKRIDFSGASIEFHTHFEDGKTFATTSLESVRSEPKQGIYIRGYEESPLAKLWEKHLDGIKRMEKEFDTVAIDHTQFNDPVSFLKQIDKFLRRLEKALR